jgi:hypothetical protein
MLMAIRVIIGLATAAVACTGVSNLVSNWPPSRYTVVNELQKLGYERSKKLKKVAVICGGRYVNFNNPIIDVELFI